MRFVGVDAHIDPLRLAFNMERRGGRLCAAVRGAGALRMREVVRPYIRLDTSRISYVKYSTGVHVTKRIAYRAMWKPDLAVARKGVRSTERGTTIRKMERLVFPRVSAIERVQCPFLPYLFPQEGKDMVAGGTVAVSPQKQHCGAIAEAPRAYGADNLRTPCAKISRILRTRSLRACGAACAQRAQNRHHSSGVTKLRPSGAENY